MLCNTNARIDQTDRSELIRISFGKVLAAQRMAAGFGQRAFSRQVGISNSHLRKIEAGETSPTLVTLYKFADVLGVETGWLLSQTDMVMRGNGAVPTNVLALVKTSAES